MIDISLLLVIIIPYGHLAFTYSSLDRLIRRWRHDYINVCKGVLCRHSKTLIHRVNSKGRIGRHLTQNKPALSTKPQLDNYNPCTVEVQYTQLRSS